MTPTRLRGAEAESVHVLRYIPPVYPSAGSFKSLQTDFHLNESSFWLEGRNSADKLRWFGATGMILKEIKAQTVHRLTCHTPPVWAAGITQTAPHPPQSLVLLASGEGQGFGWMCCWGGEGVVTHCGVGTSSHPHSLWTSRLSQGSANPLIQRPAGSCGAPTDRSSEPATLRWINTLTQLWSFSLRTDAEQDFSIESIRLILRFPAEHKRWSSISFSLVPDLAPLTELFLSSTFYFSINSRSSQHPLHPPHCVSVCNKGS